MSKHVTGLASRGLCSVVSLNQTVACRVAATFLAPLSSSSATATNRLSTCSKPKVCGISAHPLVATG